MHIHIHVYKHIEIYAYPYISYTLLASIKGFWEQNNEIIIKATISLSYSMSGIVLSPLYLIIHNPHESYKVGIIVQFVVEETKTQKG